MGQVGSRSDVHREPAEAAGVAHTSSSVTGEVSADSPVDLLRSDEAARLVTQREAVLKPGRTRINNTELLRTWEGESGSSTSTTTGTWHVE